MRLWGTPEPRLARVREPIQGGRCQRQRRLRLNGASDGARRCCRTACLPWIARPPWMFWLHSFTVLCCCRCRDVSRGRGQASWLLAPERLGRRKKAASARASSVLLAACAALPLRPAPGRLCPCSPEPASHHAELLFKQCPSNTGRRAPSGHARPAARRALQQRAV